MKAIIPVAGAGTRLRPHTHTTPKVLIQLAGKPILGHILTQLEGLPIDELVLVVGQMGDKIREYVDGAFKFKTTYIVQEKARGLADAIYLTKQTVGKSNGLIILGDTIFKADFSRILSKKHSQIGVQKVDDPRRFGVVETDGQRITRLVEKPEQPKSNLAIVGIYLIRDMPQLYLAIESLFENRVKTKGEYQLTDALELMVQAKHPMETFEVAGWYDCGKPETLLATNRKLLEMATFPAPAGRRTVFVPPVFIDPSAEVDDSVIGPYVSIAANCQVRNAVISNTIIGSNTLVENILLNGSLLGDNATVKGRLGRLNVGDDSEVDIY
jgi:glucose-1-phosphate thymidylyltransferase